MRREFSSVPKNAAQRFCARLAANAASVPAIDLIGAWRGRRFVVVKVSSRLQLPPDLPLYDFAGHTLTIPSTSAWHQLVAECAHFGNAIAGSCRRQSKYEIAYGADQNTHIVRAYHDVAICGHVGPWPDEVSSLISCNKLTCPACMAVAIARFVISNRPSAIQI